ncbi:MAG TPA: hypothetical protein VI818_01925, partial [Candidatus Thermoplasmatota archaeon]|nr:hypothetical protein [Candidatus Thermoplasmatota archaeon]
PVTAAETHMIHFQTEGQDSEEDGGGGAFDFELTSAKITAPSGYVFDQVTGLPSGASSSDKTIDFGQAYNSAATVDITMKKGGGGAPSLAPGLVVAVLVGVAVLRRGRA